MRRGACKAFRLTGVTRNTTSPAILAWSANTATTAIYPPTAWVRCEANQGLGHAFHLPSVITQPPYSGQVNTTAVEAFTFFIHDNKLQPTSMSPYRASVRLLGMGVAER